MIIGLIAIIYMALSVFNIIKIDNEKLFILVIGICFELMLFDIILYILWSK